MMVGSLDQWVGDEMDWFRFYNDAPASRKLKRVARRLGISFREVLGAFTILLCLASDSPKRGWLMLSDLLSLSIDEIADELDLTPDEAEKWINTMAASGLIEFINDTWHVIGWDSKQYASDSSKDRTKKWRDSKRHGDVTGGVTENVTVTDQSRAEQNRDRAEVVASDDAPHPLLSNPVLLAWRDCVIGGRELSSKEFRDSQQALIDLTRHPQYAEILSDRQTAQDWITDWANTRASSGSTPRHKLKFEWFCEAALRGLDSKAEVLVCR